MTNPVLGFILSHFLRRNRRQKETGTVSAILSIVFDLSVSLRLFKIGRGRQ